MLLLTLLASAAAQDACTYQLSVWDTGTRKSISTPRVDKPKSALEPHERGPMGCTPCEQDQTEITLSNGVSFQACVAIASSARTALEEALLRGAVIETVSGYRPVVSRGPVDQDGRRTVLSNHAFGAAIDINAEHNGLYANCVAFGPECTLLRGGPWKPAEDPLSLREDSPVTQALRDAGLAWGGQLEGQQKDFMHFSADGS